MLSQIPDVLCVSYPCLISSILWKDNAHTICLPGRPVNKNMWYQRVSRHTHTALSVCGAQSRCGRWISPCLWIRMLRRVCVSASGLLGWPFRGQPSYQQACSLPTYKTTRCQQSSRTHCRVQKPRMILSKHFLFVSVFFGCDSCSVKVPLLSSDAMTSDYILFRLIFPWFFDT